jgi:D-alanyl-D-alanine dipeptidase
MILINQNPTMMKKLIKLSLFGALLGAWSLIIATNHNIKTNYKKTSPIKQKIHDTTLVKILDLDSDFVIDVRYATANNFTKQVLYDCNTVWFRQKVATALVAAHKVFKEKGYRIKIYDGYRPISVQWRLWKASPKKGYVSHPSRGMRMHNRGAAIDMTLVDKNGIELDMGTAYDFFGKEAHLNFVHTPKIQANRKLLKTVMEKFGFKAISNEWWHFDYHAMKFNVIDEKMCE